jgi:2-haloacid dehalogenase
MVALFALAGVRACVFDAYGTLFDIASAVEACRDEIGPQAERLNQMWRDKQLAYTWLRAAQGRHADFAQVTEDALDFCLETLGIERPALRQRLLGLYSRLKPFPEVADVLTRLKAAGFLTAILSNGTPEMLAALVSAANLGGMLDEVLSVEAVGAFKPHPSVYQLAVDRLGVPAKAISFQSSNGWDVHAAAAFGMTVVWCNRTGQQRERLPGKPTVEVKTLAELPALLGISL